MVGIVGGRKNWIAGETGGGGGRGGGVNCFFLSFSNHKLKVTVLRTFVYT